MEQVIANLSFCGMQPISIVQILQGSYPNISIDSLMTDFTTGDIKAPFLLAWIYYQVLVYSLR